jgi:hypothetical protein
MARGFVRLTWGFWCAVVLLALPGRPEPLTAVTACTRPFCARIVPSLQHDLTPCQAGAVRAQRTRHVTSSSTVECE